MRKILVYIEPHPIRNYFEEFHGVGVMLCDALHRSGQASGYDFRFISNDHVVDRIVADHPHLSYLSLRPTVAETQAIENFLTPWDLAAIEQWLALVRGTGPTTQFYVDMLARVHQEYAFDAVLFWSDNGAVRAFCEAHGMPAISAEYGPTRSPFHQTIYLDLKGTNGAAAVRHAIPAKLQPKLEVPRETWITRQDMTVDSDSKPGVVDAGVTLDTATYDPSQLPYPYVYIPLQLADDQNTLLYSRYASPEHFLRSVLPGVLKAGFNVVVKGHPGAALRSYDLVAETLALQYAQSLGEAVTVLPRDMSPLTTMAIVGQSAAVATINSSVGFEAALMGKRVFLLGHAAYDMGFVDDGSAAEFGLAEARTLPEESVDHATSLLCGHYFLPLESLVTGSALPDVLDYVFTSGEAASDSTAFWQGWIDAISHGHNWLCERSSQRALPMLYVGNLSGNRKLIESQSRFLAAHLDGHHVSNMRKLAQASQLFAVGSTSEGRVYADVTVSTQMFSGFIDTIQTIVENDKSYLDIAGWCLEKNLLRPPIQFLLCDGTKVISHHRIAIIRRDVAEFLEKPVTARCGFHFRVDLTQISDQDDCSLAFISSTNTMQIAPLRCGRIGG